MKTRRLFTGALAMALCLSALSYRTQAQDVARKNKNQTVAPVATSSVAGSGTTGRLSKWTGVSGSTTYVLGDSNIFEDKFGKIGIGTTTPTSLLTVQGMIEITMGGLKFPDGTLQTTAFNPSLMVRSLNGLTGDVQLAAGANITITPAGNTLTIAATNALTGVTHDTTLTGNGTAGSPLGIKVPLDLTASSGLVESVIHVRNLDISGIGVRTEGGPGGLGAAARGGSSVGSNGGQGINAFGGNGTGTGRTGGAGIVAGGGQGDGSGGHGVIALGGTGNGAGASGGIGIQVIAGTGMNGATTGLAGKFQGNVEVTGTLSKGGGSFKIDHPLDPENKYLYHSFVESPDMKNIYDGNIVSDQNGEAVVTLPDYFEALNRDFRYQLTVIGTFAQAIIAEKIKGNRFVIRTDAPNVEVSWQVTGIRQDGFANKNRIPVEEAKPEVERGYYLHPEAFDQPEEKSINWARDPELMQQLKQRRLEAEQMHKRQPNQR